jgi:chloramphenicol 3-O-phosphotransferase
MKLLFLHGPAAAGKLTIGRALHELTGFRLFHNHLVVDTLLSVFQFGTPSFIRLREQMWLSVFEAAAQDGVSLVFTFAPEPTVKPKFIDAAVRGVEKAGGQVCFVELTCPVEELERRMEEPSRAQFLKLRSVATFRELMQKGADQFPSLPSSGLSIDTSAVAPIEAARRICEYFQVPTLGVPPVITNYPKI